MKLTKQNLKKTETLLEDIGYIVRYEKGNFQSGYCLVQDRKVIIVNKFYETDARINCLFSILEEIDVPTATLSEKSLKFYQRIQEQIA